GLTQEEIAQRVGRSRVAVANTLRLLQLPRPAREALAAGKLSEGHARALLGAPTEASLLDCLEQVLARALTVRQTEELVRRASDVPPKADWRLGEDPGSRPDLRPPTADDAIERAYLEERFRQALGTKVQLMQSRRGGRLIIHFYSDDELEGLYRAICGE